MIQFPTEISDHNGKDDDNVTTNITATISSNDESIQLNKDKDKDETLMNYNIEMEEEFEDCFNNEDSILNETEPNVEQFIKETLRRDSSNIICSIQMELIQSSSSSISSINQDDNGLIKIPYDNDNNNDNNENNNNNNNNGDYYNDVNGLHDLVAMNENDKNLNESLNSSSSFGNIDLDLVSDNFCDDYNVDNNNYPIFKIESLICNSNNNDYDDDDNFKEKNIEFFKSKEPSANNSNILVSTLSSSINSESVPLKSPIKNPLVVERKQQQKQNNNEMENVAGFENSENSMLILSEVNVTKSQFDNFSTIEKKFEQQQSIMSKEIDKNNQQQLSKMKEKNKIFSMEDDKAIYTLISKDQNFLIKEQASTTTKTMTEISPREVEKTSSENIRQEPLQTKQEKRTGSNKKRRSNNFLTNIISTSYRQKSLEFYRLFQKEITRNELLIGDFYCALNALQGRLYISKDHLAFYSSIMGVFAKSWIWNFSDVVSISKTNTALVIPNAIQIVFKSSSSLSSTSQSTPLSSSNIVEDNKEVVLPSTEQKYLFTSFTQRDKTFALIETVWRRSINDTSLSNQEISDIVHRFYGEDLGFMSNEEELAFFADVGGDTCDKNHVKISKNLHSSQNYQQEEPMISSSSYSPSPILSQTINNGDNNRNVEDHSQHKYINKQEISTNSSSLSLNSSTTMMKLQTTPESKNHSSNLQSLKCLTENIDETNIIDVSYGHQEINELQTTSAEGSASSQSPILPLSPETKSLNRFFQSASMSLVEGSCRCSQHKGTLMIEQVLPFPVDYLFELIFIDQNLIRLLHKSRQTTEIKINPWMAFEERDRPLAPIPDGDYDITQCEYRIMVYTVKVNGLPLVKSSVVQENQYILQSDSNRAYCLFSQIKNQGIPYSDSFLVSSTWCLNSCLPKRNDVEKNGELSKSTTISLPTHTKLVIYFNIHYIKNSLSLSLIKSSIEKNSIQGFREFIHDLLKLLKTNRFDYITQSMMFNESISNSSLAKRQSISSSISTNSKNTSADLITLNSESFDIDTDNLNQTKSLNTYILGIILTTIQLLFDFLAESMTSFSDSKLLKIVFIMIMMITIVNMSLLKQFHDVESRLLLMINLIQESLKVSSTSSSISILNLTAENFVNLRT